MGWPNHQPTELLGIARCQLLESRYWKQYETAPVPFRHVLLKRHAPCKTSQAGTSGTVWKFAVWSVKRQRQLVFVLRYFFWIWIWFTFVPFGSFRNTSQIVCGPVAHAYPPSICSRAEYRHRTSNHSAARQLGKANEPRLFSTFFNCDQQISSLSDNSNKFLKKNLAARSTRLGHLDHPYFCYLLSKCWISFGSITSITSITHFSQL